MSSYSRLPRVFAVAAPLLLAATGHLGAQESPPDTSVTVRFGGFVDGYFAYDFGGPHAIDRGFTTQSARHNEFNVNLAFLDAVLTGTRVRGRFAAQFGTSVQSNYADEPRVGSNSGPDIARFIQEATVGVRVSDKLWVDGGIYLSHIGSESWISRDNLTYTRSIIADYSPYYQAGAKLSWQATPTLAAQLHVVNGWQIISETNTAKSVGARIDWTVTPKTTVSLYNLIGSETPDSVPSQLRLFQGASIKLLPTDRLTLLATFDVGTQDLGADRGTWYGTSLVARVQATPLVAVIGRVERYDDTKQVIIVTGTSDPFRVSGGSVGVDVLPAPRVLWRSELRLLQGTYDIFPENDGRSRNNGVLVTSLALTF